MFKMFASGCGTKVRLLERTANRESTWNRLMKKAVDELQYKEEVAHAKFGFRANSRGETRLVIANIVQHVGFTTQYVQHRFSGCGYNGEPILGRTMH
jgi:hypothetical protein